MTAPWRGRRCSWPASVRRVKSSFWKPESRCAERTPTSGPAAAESEEDGRTRHASLGRSQACGSYRLNGVPWSSEQWAMRPTSGTVCTSSALPPSSEILRTDASMSVVWK